MRLGDLAGRIQAFHDMRTTLVTPDFIVRFNRHSMRHTFLLCRPARRQQLEIKPDERGMLAEFMKSNTFGQIFVSRTKPGVHAG